MREALERGVCDLLDVFGSAIQAGGAGLVAGMRLEAELGGDHHLITQRSQGFAD